MCIRDSNYSVYDLIQDFGGFLQDASLDGIKIVRENKLNDIIEEENDSSKFFGLSNKDSLNIKVQINPFIEFGVDGDNFLKSLGINQKYNVILNSNDKIIVAS